jgi:hypothetical protein
VTGLIDRYVYTALRRVPEKQRADIDRELRASIDDAVDARTENGEPRDTAIEQTLLELGDPDLLADRYANRPQMLIGPDLYPIWRRILTMLLTVVLPIVVGVTLVAKYLSDREIGPAIGTAVITALTTAVHMAFWTTAVFAVLERSGVVRGNLSGPWTLDDLPKYEPGRLTAGQLAAGLVWPVLIAVALVLQQFTFTDEPVLNPANWSFWWPYLLVVLSLEAAYAVWVYRGGTWTHTVTLVNAALGVLYTGPLVWLLATHRFFNPGFVQGLDWGTADPLYWLTTIGIIVVVLTAVWDVAEVAIKAERARRGLPPVAALNADTAARALRSLPLQMRRQRENDRNG